MASTDNNMIFKNSVVALHNSFVTADRLDTPNLLHSIHRPAILRAVLNHESKGILVETNSFGIIVSPHTKFIDSNYDLRFANKLKEGRYVLTTCGFQPVRNVLSFNVEVPMVELLFKGGFDIYLAEGFYLVD